MNTQKPSRNAQKKDANPQQIAKTAKKLSGASEITKEIGGFSDQGLQEPTRYGDWEVKGRCSDF